LPKYYILANVKVTDPQQYEEYKKLSTKAFQAHGVQPLVRGGAVEVLEGDWTPDRAVMLEFPSKEKALEWYHSQEYQAAKQSRQGAAIMRMVLIEGA
jgi:uncharacterized protein (DUF1330 family)